MKNIFVKRKSKVSKLSEKVEQLTEATTYAEAGLPEAALKVFEREAAEKPKIIVLGKDYTFSPALKDYAVGLASRLGYEIVAVSAKHFPSDFLSAGTPFREKLREDFSTKAKKAAAEFESQAKAAGVGFQHLIKYGEGMAVIKELQREFKKLEYVLTEPDETASCADGVTPAIPVFSLALSS